jgi:hypothetical protein
MKNSIGIVLVLAFVFISSDLTAQDLSPRVQEFGIGLSNLNSFSMQYLWGNENRLSRISLTLGISSLNTILPKQYSNINDSSFAESITAQTTPININGTLSYSKIKIKSLTDKFGLVFGNIFAFSSSYVLTKNKVTLQEFINGNPIINTSSYTLKNSTALFQPSIGIVLGAVYKINAAFSFYAEIDPNLYYRHTANIVTGNNNQYVNTYGLANVSNSGASLTLVYKITK